MTNPDVDHLTKLLKTREEIVLGAVLWDTRDKEPSRLVYILVKVRCPRRALEVKLYQLRYVGFHCRIGDLCQAMVCC